jgi:hypothetical protein
MDALIEAEKIAIPAQKEDIQYVLDLYRKELDIPEISKYFV